MSEILTQNGSKIGIKSTQTQKYYSVENFGRFHILSRLLQFVASMIETQNIILFGDNGVTHWHKSLNDL